MDPCSLPRTPLLGFLPLMLVIASCGCTATQERPALAEVSYASNSSVGAFSGRVPPVSQASIDEALVRFHISIPSGVNRPRFDPELTDRGLTVWRAFGGATTVKIGPPAFSSWALLGSTLAHELEVHCRQNLFRITVREAFGFKSKLDAEVQAYTYEMSHASRFGLSQDEVERIEETLLALQQEGDDQRLK